MTGPRINSQRQHPYRRRLSRDEHAAIAGASHDGFAARNPEKAIILGRWEKGEIDGEEAGRLMKKADRRRA